MNIIKPRGQGFTLIELLVVIAIIATLATVSVPFIQTAQVKARMTRAGSDARNILIALTAYAAENGGVYPEGDTYANEALGKLLPRHLDQETTFWVQGDRYFCDPAKQPDESSPWLEAGENHWAYVSGLTDSHRSNTPILADGFTDGLGRYDQYHTWSKLQMALVGHMDGSVQPQPIADDGEVKGPNGNDSLFASPAIANDEMVKLLNPERRKRSRDH